MTSWPAHLNSNKGAGLSTPSEHILINIGKWPNDDRAEAQRIVPNPGSKRKMMYEQTNLDERALKRPASGG